MYPPARSTARASSSAATSAQTNPLRSNNNRNEQSNRKSPGAEATISTQRAIADSERDFSGSQSMDDRSAEQAKETQRLNQIVQVSSATSPCHTPIITNGPLAAILR